MNKLTTFSLIVLSLPLLSGCGSSGAPACTDDDVIALVKDIAHDRLGTLLAGKYSEERLMAGDADLATYFTLRSGKGYKELNNAEGKPQELTQLLETINQKLANMKVTAIRTNEINDQIKKCSCGAQIEIPSFDPVPITYSGQYTEDGQIWVEVSGLQ